MARTYRFLVGAPTVVAERQRARRWREAIRQFDLSAARVEACECGVVASLRVRVAGGWIARCARHWRSEEVEVIA